MNALPSHALDGELDTLWQDRARLDEQGWARLYGIVRSVLLPLRPRELASLPEPVEVYVQDFFQDKVFRPEAQASRVHVGALRHYYTNYLRDRLDRHKRHDDTFVPLTHDAGDDGEEMADDMAACAPTASLVREALAEVGLSFDQACAAARRFLETAEPWVAPYLAFHFCPDADSSVPLHHLAQRLDLPSYHYKAKKLGINWSGKDRQSADFSSTLLGQWLSQELGLTIAQEHRDAMDAALQILCLEALTWGKTQESLR